MPIKTRPQINEILRGIDLTFIFIQLALFRFFPLLCIFKIDKDPFGHY